MAPPDGMPCRPFCKATYEAEHMLVPSGPTHWSAAELRWPHLLASAKMSSSTRVSRVPLPKGAGARDASGTACLSPLPPMPAWAFRLCTSRMRAAELAWALRSWADMNSRSAYSTCKVNSAEVQ